MTSSNRNAFRITVPLCAETTDDRWIPLIKGQWWYASIISLMSAWPDCWKIDKMHLNWYVLKLIWLHFTDEEINTLDFQKRFYTYLW